MQEPATFPRDELFVSIDTPAGAFRGVLVDSRVEGVNALVTVDFPRLEAPFLPIGEDARVEILATSSSEGHEFSGMVVFHGEDPFRHRYQFQFGQKDHPVLSALEGRRGPLRVAPDARDRLDVELSSLAGESRARARLQDLSLGGLSVLIPREEEFRLADEWEFRLSFRLPHDDEPLEFHGAVRYRRLAGTHVQYGIEFDADGTRDFTQALERVSRYVKARQAQLLVTGASSPVERGA